MSDTSFKMLLVEEQKQINKLKRGDITAYNSLFEAYHKKIFNFSYSILHSFGVAEDITQEVFIAIWQNRQSINSNTSFSSYIFTIAKNKMNDYFRKKVNQAAYMEYVVNQKENFQFITEQEIDFRELKSILDSIIDQLPPKRKEIFLLNRFQGLTYKEIAEKLQISENTVDTQMRKALEFLRNEYKDAYLLLYLLLRIIP